MGRAPCCDKTKVKKGPWSPEEDATLRNYLEKHGTGGNWIALPHKAGLKRCGKSCRLRWLNYLRPDIKHGCYTEEEDSVIYDLYSKLGSRWSFIASQLPGRTDNDVKNHWNTRLKKKQLLSSNMNDNNSNPTGNPTLHVSTPSTVLVPKTEPFNLMSSSSLLSQSSLTMAAHGLDVYTHGTSHAPVHLPMPELTKFSELKQNAKKNYCISSSEEASNTLDSFSFSTDNNYPSWSQNNSGSTIDFDAEFSCDLIKGIWSQEKASTEAGAAYADLVSYFYADTKTPELCQSVSNQY